MKKVTSTALFLAVILCLVFPATVAAAEEEVTPLPILMYHSVSTTQRGVYFVTPQQLEADLTELTRRGYSFVTIQAVKAYLKNEGDLPPKPVLITFDDGHFNNLYYGLEILKKHGAKAVVNVIGCFTEYSSTHEKDQPEYSHLTWEEIAYLARTGIFEVGSHTYKMHAYKPRFGIKRMRGESLEDYRRALNDDLDRIDQALLQKSGVYPVCFAYPFGAYDDESERIVKSRYDAIFTCYEVVNRLKRGDSAKLSKLYRINRDGTLTTQSFLNKHKIR